VTGQPTTKRTEIAQLLINAESEKSMYDCTAPHEADFWPTSVSSWKIHGIIRNGFASASGIPNVPANSCDADQREWYESEIAEG
jgi:hypothetical protein